MKNDLTEEQKEYLAPVVELGNKLVDLLNEHDEGNPNIICSALCATLAMVIGENAISEESIEEYCSAISKYLSTKTLKIFHEKMSSKDEE